MTTDDFLGGRVKLRQNKVGLRATSDSVLVAAAVLAQAGDTVFDVGTGNGIIPMCLNARIPNLKITGIDCQPDLVKLAQENAALNSCDLEVICGDITGKPSALHGRQFHHVVTNPPFYDEPHPRKNEQQAKAYHQDISVAEWLGLCLKYVRAKGWLTVIARSEALTEILTAMALKLGNIEVIPIVSKQGEDAKRVIVRGVMNSRAPLRLRSPIVMHLKSGKRSAIAEKILRLGEGIE